jgi:eight-cysteine-cluster-containing protein
MSRIPLHRVGAALGAALLSLVATACEKPTPPPGGTATSPADDGGQVAVRKPAVPADHPLHDRFEGVGFANDCGSDSQCHAAGCGSEVCSADAGVVTTCEALPVALPAKSACGCVDDQCRWWNPDGLTLPELPPAEEPPKEVSCATILCEAPKQCVEYYGIAGPSGPKFASCEIRCTPGSLTAAGGADKKKGDCPQGMSCVTIADGPGSVCR